VKNKSFCGVTPRNPLKMSNILNASAASVFKVEGLASYSNFFFRVTEIWTWILAF